jgi:hypothetical protein
MQRGRNNNGSGPSLRITDFSDRELLAIARDLSNSDGLADIEEVALQIWPRGKRDADWLWHAIRCVSIRFSHMSRLGLLEKIGTGKWELTDLGEEVVAGKLKSIKLITQAGDMYEEATDDQASLMRREFQFRIARRKW